VEKIGPDFHRLAAPTRPKSTIRSIPKYGSGVVGFSAGGLLVLVGLGYAFRTGVVTVHLAWLLPAGQCNTGLWIPQGMQLD
jgi:hypothetical protein